MSAMPPKQTIPSNPKSVDPIPKPHIKGAFLVVPIKYALDTPPLNFSDNTYYLQGRVYYRAHSSAEAGEKATKKPPSSKLPKWGNKRLEEPNPLSPTSHNDAKAHVKKSLKKGNHDATFVVFRDFEEGWDMFTDLLKVKKKKRVAEPLCYVYNKEMDSYLLGLSRFYPCESLSPDMADDDDVFSVTPKSKFEFLCVNTTPMSEFVPRNPSEDYQEIVKEISEAFGEAMLDDLSFPYLDCKSSYVTGEDGVIKIFKVRGKTDTDKKTGEPYSSEDWSQVVKDDIRLFKHGVKHILFPGDEWQQKELFLESFDLVPCGSIDRRGDHHSKLFCEHPFLMSRINHLLEIVWRADHIIQNRDQYHPNYGKEEHEKSGDDKPDLDYDAFVKYVGGPDFIKEVCGGSLVWIQDSAISNGHLRQFLLGTYLTPKAKRANVTSLDMIPTSIRQSGETMINCIRNHYQHLKDNSMGMHMLFEEVMRIWPRFISGLHVKLFQRK